MKLLDRIKNKIIQILDPGLNKNYKQLQNNHQDLEQEYSKLIKEHKRLEDNYDDVLYRDNEKEEAINKLSETNEILKNSITKTILQTLSPKLGEMTLGKLEHLYKTLNYEDKQLKEIYTDSKNYDIELEIYLSKGNLINDVSEEILGKEELWHLFPEEDARGTFEFANGYDMTRWREYYHFGKVIDIEHISCYEFCKYKLDYSNKDYAEYKKKLYREVIPRELKKYISYIVKDNPEILSNTEEYLKKIEKEFIQERTDKTIETAKGKQYDETQEAEDEEEI